MTKYTKWKSETNSEACLSSDVRNQELFVSACVACPSDKVKEFAGMVLVVYIGVEDLRDL